MGIIWKEFYLFVYIDVIPFKVSPHSTIYNYMQALLPILKTLLELGLCDGFEHFRRYSFNHIYACKTTAFQGSHYFWAQEKVARGHVWRIWMLGRHRYSIVFCQKFTDIHKNYRRDEIAVDCFATNPSYFK